ncbi:hypothetical protein G9451_04415 [Enterobacter kobei]|uniref:hypothetical protein n=1 Tax=Enterobacter kobei TaxID=208224 RepID=UPI0018817C0D|nr:hypothetical protein [Enterobacter kobei]MBE8915150.1 hypothetical protein [Enterobacter kobei]
MSTITREFTKERLQQIIETDHVQCGEASALARIAMASLEAEPVAYMNRFTGRVFTLEEQPGADTDAQVYMPVYTAPPAPVSVPAAMEMDDDFDSSFEHGKAVGWNAYRAAMLQSFGNSEQLNSPVIPDGWVMVPIEPTMEILDEFDSIIDYGAEDSKEAWSRLIAAAPQQEVK